MNKFVFLILLISVTSWARPEVSIPSEVEISQRELLRLGDIAEVQGGDEALLGLLDSIVIRPDARELLLSQHLNSSEILTKMRAALEENQELKKQNPAFKVPSQVKVNFATTPISRQEVERKIRNHLKSQCHDCEYKISIQSTPTPSNKLWDLDMTQLTPKGGFLLPVRDGDSKQIKWISGTIRVSKLTPVTTRLILQGERLQSEDLRMSMTDITFAKDGALRMEDIAGQAAARSLPVGTAVWAGDLKREPAAKRGQVIKALIGDDTFEVTANVQAEDNGFIGDLIKVKNLETQKVLSGLVVDKGVVKLQ
ncbi:flagellar basal body P-ring formation chaperone FlgA [Bdellovibrio sp. HCB2-146]|uniref:flagellar basal body P-ring formation chaperone FlgA n=1 Tax=Bdellovibrio sp. HCB2-146 TaxID=3394362 RepID=UPI0039BC8E75